MILISYYYYFQFTKLYGESGSNRAEEDTQVEEIKHVKEEVGSKVAVQEKTRKVAAPKGTKSNPVLVM